MKLHGYKSFASRTEFVFDGGITAIVGPNGSGKSNIADAIRWVLGEQSYRALRGKRTEDMIFSGSEQRARMGMASASITLDNADEWLPIDFAEVFVGRRAYRSGENEYLLNNNRVRLRDINELLSTSGLAERTYTVVGQGLVDAVLSLRADDRRELFEEAAGISLYQSKRADALARLEETQANLVRVNDIINEIAPRLNRLEREAERAKHHAMLTQQLEGLLRAWYGYHWRQEQRNLLRTRDARKRREEALARRRRALDGWDERMAALRVRQSQLREHVGGWRRERGDLHRQMEAVQRDLAVRRERARLLTRQSDELQSELTGLDAQAQAVTERIAAAEREVTAAQAALRGKEELEAKAQKVLDTHEEQRAELSRHLAEEQSRALDLMTQINDRRSRLAQLDERREDLAEERGRHKAAIADQQAHAAELRTQMRASSEEQARLRSEEKTLAAEQVERDEQLAEAQARQEELHTRLTEAQRELERFQTRYELLTRLRVEGEGLQAGVRAVLQADTRDQVSGSLPGIIGAVAQLFHVPAEYEVAIEVALGGHLQDIVVESWADAEAAIAYLREGQRGQATFLPLDTVRPGQRLAVPEDQGVVGIAADLIRAEECLTPVVEMLVGRTVIVRDLEAARRVFERMDGGFQIVTLPGELLRSTGSVMGGAGKGGARGQILAREREWRALPGRLETAQANREEIETALDKARAAERQVREQMANLADRRREAETSLARVEAKRQDSERQAERVAQQIAWRRELLAELDEEAKEFDMAEASLRSDLEQLVVEKELAEGQVAALQAELDGLRGEVLYGRLSEARTATAVARGKWEHRQAELDNLRDRRAEVQEQVAAKRQRLTELEEEQAALGKKITQQVSREAVVQGWLSSLREKIEPAEEEIARLEALRQELEQEETTLRARLRQAESSLAQAQLAHSRQQDRLEQLRRQITDDFGLVEMEFTDDTAGQLPLPLGELVSRLPSVETLPEGLEGEIHQIKAQMRRMGTVNADAPAEYNEVLDRHAFLTTQTADLEEAARGLREVIAELDEVMQRKFLATFEAVDANFREYFPQLFGGGTARLQLTEPDDISQTGVEIVAHPPGKRRQTLALLSGGERSLTAVALIFSILAVSPPPFCILDEVDAMLDEANIRRFRQALVALAEKTQFIVITHNRGTIEAADTIYGVSMGDDSVSQVVSLRLEGNRIAAPDGSMVDVMKAR
jgi:chromosome segregation protein